jgi:HTH-type transcriptional regulator/antitoxin MqsA
MASKRQQHLPATMVSPETGEELTRGVRPFSVSCKGKTLIVQLPGYYPAGEGDGVLVGDDMNAVDAALRSLKQSPPDR